MERMVANSLNYCLYAVIYRSTWRVPTPGWSSRGGLLTRSLVLLKEAGLRYKLSLEMKT